MKGKVAAALLACTLLFSRPAFAHRIDEYLQATLLSLQPNSVQASMRLIPGILVAPSVIDAIDSNHDGTFSQTEERAYARRVLGDLSIRLNGQGIALTLVSWSFPQPADMREGLGEINLEYTAELLPGPAHRTLILENRHLAPTSVYLVNVVVPEDRNLRILGQKRNQRQSVYQVDYQQEQSSRVYSPTAWNRLQAWQRGLSFSSLFHLGVRHIAEGTDHLLFLLTLLLPAPLLVSGSRWGPPAGLRHSLLRVVRIVTAFTIGHSLTLTLAALGTVHVPGRPVEALIAVSIFISAIHALHPTFPGKEDWIAAGFGLIHGLAFAATLDRLGLDRWDRVAGILAFNLGIETMQMLVVAAILPSLMLISRTPAYSTLRIAGATFAGIASFAWMVERLFNVETHTDEIVNSLARHAVAFATFLFLVGLACRYLLYSRTQPRLVPIESARKSSVG